MTGITITHMGNTILQVTELPWHVTLTTNDNKRVEI